MKEDLRRSKSKWTCTDAKGAVCYDMVVKGHGVLKITIVTVDDATGRVEIRAACEDR